MYKICPQKGGVVRRLRPPPPYLRPWYSYHEMELAAEDTSHREVYVRFNRPDDIEPLLASAKCSYYVDIVVRFEMASLKSRQVKSIVAADRNAACHSYHEIELAARHTHPIVKYMSVLIELTPLNASSPLQNVYIT